MIFLVKIVDNIFIIVDKLKFPFLKKQLVVNCDELLTTHLYSMILFSFQND